MSVTIVKNLKKCTYLTIKDFVDGRAYMEIDGPVYIANRYGDIAAFSICGRYVVETEDTSLRFQEVHLNITVEN